jgi:hypothetical protein
MTVANLRYGHLEQPWNSPLSFGVQAFIEYNGYIINDRYQSDLIRVTGITGLDSSEVREGREPRPAQHNEFVYDAFYNGRVITLTGNIETGSLQVYNQLKGDFLAAYAPLVESSLKFKWFDIYDNFDEAQTILPYSPIASLGSGNYEALIGSNSNLEVNNGFLSWSKAGENYLIRASEKRVFGNVQSTIKIIRGSKSESTFGYVFSVKDDENFAKVLYNDNEGEPFLSILIIIENEVKELEKIALPENLRPEIGELFYLRGKKIDNRLSIEFWKEKPSDNNVPSIMAFYDLGGSYADLFGEEIVSQVGFGGDQKDVLWNFDEYRIESIYPGDVEFNCRCITPPQIKEEQTTINKIKRPFQVVLKSSDFRAFSTAQLSNFLIPNNSESPLLGRSYPRSYPRGYRKFIGSTVIQDNNILSICNRGKTFVEPVFVIYGPFESILISNLTNNLEVYYNAPVAENDYLIFECGKRKTLVNSNGSNKLENFSSSSSAWIVLEPMWNDIYITGKGFGEKSLLAVYYEYGFLG